MAPALEKNLSAILDELSRLRSEIGRLQCPAPRLLTVGQAAAYLGLAPKTVRNGLGPKAVRPFPVRPVRVVGRVLFRLIDLENFVDSLAINCDDPADPEKTGPQPRAATKGR